MLALAIPVELDATAGWGGGGGGNGVVSAPSFKLSCNRAIVLATVIVVVDLELLCRSVAVSQLGGRKLLALGDNYLPPAYS